MSSSSSSSSSSNKGRFCKSVDEDGNELRRGPWTVEEDNLLIQHITSHGEGQWNSLAKSAGLKRTGKSCRLRWLNYLKPDVKRGNLTPHEQLLILELHSRWGNRWSKIAQHLPGRTDNEIKNYWRTRVQKQARQLKVDSNSNKFLEAVRLYWMPRLLEKIQQSATSSPSSDTPNPVTVTAPVFPPPSPESEGAVAVTNSSGGGIQEINGFLTAFDQDGCYHVDIPGYDDMAEMSVSDRHAADDDWFGDEIIGTSFWNTDELWQFGKVNL